MAMHPRAMGNRYGAAHASEMLVMPSTPLTRSASLNVWPTERSGSTTRLSSPLMARIDDSGDVCVVIHQDETYARVDDGPPRDVQIFSMEAPYNRLRSLP